MMWWIKTLFLCDVSVKGGKSSAPSFAAKPTIRMLGSSVIFEVRLNADPTPTITWSREGKTVTEGVRHAIVTRTDGLQYILTLEINDVKDGDAGSYKVTAKNKMGESNASITLNLEGGENIPLWLYWYWFTYWVIDIKYSKGMCVTRLYESSEECMHVMNWVQRLDIM